MKIIIIAFVAAYISGCAVLDIIAEHNEDFGDMRQAATYSDDIERKLLHRQLLSLSNKNEDKYYMYYRRNATSGYKNRFYLKPSYSPPTARNFITEHIGTTNSKLRDALFEITNSCALNSTKTLHYSFESTKERWVSRDFRCKDFGFKDEADSFSAYSNFLDSTSTEFLTSLLLTKDLNDVFVGYEDNPILFEKVIGRIVSNKRDMARILKRGDMNLLLVKLPKFIKNKKIVDSIYTSYYENRKFRDMHSNDARNNMLLAVSRHYLSGIKNLSRKDRILHAKKQFAKNYKSKKSSDALIWLYVLDQENELDTPHARYFYIESLYNTGLKKHLKPAIASWINKYGSENKFYPKVMKIKKRL